MKRAFVFVVLIASICAFAAGRKHKDKAVIVKESSVRLTELYGHPTLDGGLELKLCFEAPGETPRVPCVIANGAAMQLFLNGVPLDQWKTANGF